MSSSALPQPARYIGRFAPTPSGYLHFGSLIAALASYLDARSVGGLWLLRMEDIDPPREMPGAQRAIVETLQSYGFEWDGDMLRQSERQAAYRDAIERLLDEGLAYACTCSRKQLEGYPAPTPVSAAPPAAASRMLPSACAYPIVNTSSSIVCKASSASIWAARSAILSFAAATA